MRRKRTPVEHAYAKGARFQQFAMDGRKNPSNVTTQILVHTTLAAAKPPLALYKTVAHNS